MPLVQPFSFLGGAEAAWPIPRKTGETDNYWGTRVNKARDANYYIVAYSGLEENPWGNKFDVWIVHVSGLTNDWFQLPGIALTAMPSVFNVGISDDGLFALVHWRTTGWGEMKLFKRTGSPNTWSLHRDIKTDFNISNTDYSWHCVLRDRYIHGSCGNNMEEDSEHRVLRIESDDTTVTNLWFERFTYSPFSYGYRWWMGDITADGELLCIAHTQYRWSHSGHHSVERYSWLDVYKADNPGRTSYTQVAVPAFSLGYGQSGQVWRNPRFSRDNYHILWGTRTSGRIKVARRDDASASSWTEVLSEAASPTYCRGCDIGAGRDALGNVQTSGPPYAGAQPTILYIDRNTPGVRMGVWNVDHFDLATIPPPTIFTDTRLYDGSLELTAGKEGYRWNALGGPFDNLVAARPTY